MANPPRLESDPGDLARQVDALRAGLRASDPAALAARCGAAFQAGELRLVLWGEPMGLAFPELVARREADGGQVSLPNQALLMYYLATADGTPPAGRWIAFSELPGGRFYQVAYQGYSGEALRRAFGADLAAFARAAARLDGQPLEPGAAPAADAAFVFQPLPRLALLAAAWQGDEDFPESYGVLFDAAASHYLPTDVCAILGGGLARKLVQARAAG